MVDWKRLVLASGFARMVRHTLEGEFAIVSAFKSDRPIQENNKRTAELKQLVRQMGYGFIPGKGVWDGAAEKSLFIPGMSEQEVKSLAERFEQQSYVHGDKGRYRIVGTDGSLYGEGLTGKDFHQFTDAEMKGLPPSETGHTETRGRSWAWDEKRRQQPAAGEQSGEQPGEQPGEGERLATVYYRLSNDIKYVLPRSSIVRARYRDGMIVTAGKSIGVQNLDFLIPLKPSEDAPLRLSGWVMGNCKFGAASHGARSFVLRGSVFLDGSRSAVWAGSHGQLVRGLN